MTEAMNHEDFDADGHDAGDDLAAYALGALDAHEAEAFQAHLAGCALCRDELAALQGVVEALPTSVPPYPASKTLRRKLVAAVAAEPKGAEAAEAKATRAPARPRRWGLPRAGLTPRLGLAMATVAAVFVVAAGALTLGGGTAGTRVITAQVIGSPGTAQVRLSGGHAELVVTHFAPPPPGHIYEVWLQRDGGRPIPTGALFSVTSSGAGDVDVPGRLRGVSGMMVTPEPDGGSLVPTHAPVIRAALT
ncbi:MAG: anti-sigma factor domain-containing protein [Solirubrobacteraceae bacterium]